MLENITCKFVLREVLHRNRVNSLIEIYKQVYTITQPIFTMFIIIDRLLFLDRGKERITHRNPIYDP